MAFQPTPTDVSVIITNASSSRASAEPSFVTERRITPTWTVEQVKGKLETMTGVPPGSQRLLVKVPGRPDQWADEADRAIGDWGLVKGSEIEVGHLFFSLFFPCPLKASVLSNGIYSYHKRAAFYVHLRAGQILCTREIDKSQLLRTVLANGDQLHSKPTVGLKRPHKQVRLSMIILTRFAGS